MYSVVSLKNTYMKKTKFKKWKKKLIIIKNKLTTIETILLICSFERNVICYMQLSSLDNNEKKKSRKNEK